MGVVTHACDSCAEAGGLLRDAEAGEPQLSILGDLLKIKIKRNLKHW